MLSTWHYKARNNEYRLLELQNSTALCRKCKLILNKGLSSYFQSVGLASQIKWVMLEKSRASRVMPSLMSCRQTIDRPQVTQRMEHQIRGLFSSKHLMAFPYHAWICLEPMTSFFISICHFWNWMKYVYFLFPTTVLRSGKFKSDFTGTQMENLHQEESYVESHSHLSKMEERKCGPENFCWNGSTVT